MWGWRRRRRSREWRDAVGQLEGGKSAEQQLLDGAEPMLFTQNLLGSRGSYRNVTRKTTKTEWKGD